MRFRMVGQQESGDLGRGAGADDLLPFGERGVAARVRRPLAPAGESREALVDSSRHFENPSRGQRGQFTDDEVIGGVRIRVQSLRW